MSSNANFAITPRYEVAQASVANTAWDGSGTIVMLFEAGPNGSRVDQVGWAAAGSSSAGLLKFFVRESSEDTWRFFFATAVSAITASTTVAPWGGGATNLNWVLSAGAQIGFAPSIGEAFNAHVTLAGDF
jgi:hypothetical protein